MKVLASYPLSPMQQGMLYHTTYEQQPGYYIEQMVCHLHEKLNVPVLMQSWQQVVERHPVLRTRFAPDAANQLQQSVCDRVQLPFTQQDWQGLSSNEQDRELAEYLQSDRQRNFDLAAAPLMRLAGFQRSEADYTLVWTFHHVLLDGRSISIVLQEVFALYDGYCLNQTPLLSDRRPFQDYINWLQQQQSFAETETFWRELLQGFTTPTHFPSLRQNTGEASNDEVIFHGTGTTASLGQLVGSRYGLQQIQLSAELTTPLKKLAQEHQLTLNTFVQGAWAVLLSHYSGDLDVVFGATRACRYSAIETMESMVGLFINTIPVRARIQSDTELLPWLQALRSHWIALREYEHTPLVKVQQWSELTGGTPLFESILIFDNIDLNTELQSQGGNWTHREFELHEQMQYPLVLNAYGGSNLTLKIHFDRQKFEEAVVVWMLSHLETLLQSFVENPQQRVVELPQLTPAEQQLLFMDWNNPQADYPHDRASQQLSEYQVMQEPVAISTKEQLLSNPSFSCFVIGDGILALSCLNILLQQGCQVLGVYSTDKSLQEWAKEQDINHALSRPIFKEQLLGAEYDYLFSINNVQWIIPDDVIARARKATINYHDSPLPKYAGLYATSWALLNGETQHAVSWHEVLVELDAGRIFKQKSVPILPDDTVFNLNTRCFDAAISSFSELVRELAMNSVEPYLQDRSQRSYFSPNDRPVAASLISFDSSSKDICNLLKALDFGPLRNQLGLPKIWLPGGVVVVGAARSISGSHGTPGQIMKLDTDGVCIATADGAVQLSDLSTVDGRNISVEGLIKQYGVRVGYVLPVLDPDTRDAISKRNAAICRHELVWLERLVQLAPFQHPYLPLEISSQTQDNPIRRYPISLLAKSVESKVLLATFAAYCARLSTESEFDLGLQTDAQRSIAPEIFAQRVPLRVQTRANSEIEESFSQFKERFEAALDKATRFGSFRYSLLRRYPELRDRAQHNAIPVAIALLPSPTQLDWRHLGASMALVAYEDGSQPELVHTGAIDDVYSAEIVQQLQNLITACIENPEHPLEKLPLMGAQEKQRILVEWNHTAIPYPSDRCIHDLFELQAARHPEAIALAFEDRQLTYRELNEQSNQVAHYLRLQGVSAEVMVGLHMERSLEMMVGLLGIHKAGGAYVPLDPDFPSDRIAFMLEDSQAPVILTQQRLIPNLAVENNIRIVPIDALWNQICLQPTANLDSGVKPENLSYVIYTSGSTGRPKGVMIEHRNAVNFFTGMDSAIDHELGRVWLAVTSLSFDISILELFWTLARGFKVVIYNPKVERDRTTAAVSPLKNANKSIDFSLFYFSSNEAGEDATAKYRLLIEGANSFKAVWTPERHFHAFGGLFPNSAVTSAALATITKQIQIRAGSCVSPLHSSIRIAEDWSVVDNLSSGRVGISFAAGWQPNDFVLRPETFQTRKDVMFQQIEEVQTLWRGGIVAYPNGKGESVDVRTLPRPVQSELPVWVTAAGNPETFQMAGAGGFNILTHLLGQSLDELAAKIAIYRQAWEENNHPGKGTVTLMLHTFVGQSADTVKEIVRQPMRQYLASSLDLIKLAAWSFPTFKQKTTDESGKFSMSHLSEQDMDDVLDFSFERYFETSGLFGTVDTCLQTVDRIKGIDVDEIACLIDYGVDSEAVLAQLPLLNEVRSQANRQVSQIESQFEMPSNSVADLIQRHQVTHLQCTPSMASLLVADTSNRKAIAQIQTMMVGGEAFTEALATQLQQIVPGQIHNMYGPTETTIWSATHTLRQVDGVVPIGRPIANTELYVLDKNLQPVPVGVAGELFIGGKGVARGYLNRPELTQERFVPNPFSTDPGDRLYRTGDLVRYRADSNLEFLGRVDFQVKVRGYRIELGEIETILSRHGSVREAVIVAREDVPGDKRLVAYVLAKPGKESSPAILRDYLLKQLPEYMVPSHFAVLEAFPLTPNNKVDRKALPAPNLTKQHQEILRTAPQNPIEQTLLEIWQKVLHMPEVGTDENFFDLGGNSLIAVALIGEIRAVFNVDLPLISLFRAPTVAGLAHQIEASQTEQTKTDDLAAMIEQLQLSEEEVMALLAQ
jgi:natural product biosynthesis luciferase-like monooxygenase protein